jgi:hypothetical protein
VLVDSHLLREATGLGGVTCSQRSESTRRNAHRSHAVFTLNALIGLASFAFAVHSVGSRLFGGLFVIGLAGFAYYVVAQAERRHRNRR